MGRVPVRRTGTLRAVPDETTRLEYRSIHGYRRAFRIAGSGPLLVLIHGIGDNSRAWRPVMADLARTHTVVAPDLLGHGRSDKPRADYSVPAYANGLRDLLGVLGVDRATIIGHSLGGGVAMQLAYQFPSLVERLVLVSTGGVTSEVHTLLRLASLPAASEALSLLRWPGVRSGLRLAGTLLDRAGVDAAHDTPNLMRVLDGLPDAAARAAFLRTLRGVVDWRGQSVTMLDRSYLTQGLPVQLVWGEKDLLIPVSHAHLAHAAMPGSRLEIFEGSGHFPFRDDPYRFLDLVRRFLAETEPSPYDQDAWRALLATGGPEESVSGPPELRNRVLELMATDERGAT